jgi:hypothetical protein
VLLGSARPGHWEGREEARMRGARKAGKVAGKVAARNADEAYSDLFPVLGGFKAEGLSLREIAARLNEQGHTTRRGRPWNAVQVSRVLERAEAHA